MGRDVTKVGKGKRLRAFATETTSELDLYASIRDWVKTRHGGTHVLGLNGDTLGVDGGQAARV